MADANGINDLRAILRLREVRYFASWVDNHEYRVNRLWQLT